MALAFSATELADPDIWWATAAGRYFLEHGIAPPVAFYGEHGCYDAEPLDQVLAWSLFGGVHARFGLWGLFVVRALFTIAIALVTALALRRSFRWPVAVAGSGLILAVLSFRLSVRSELWTLLLLPVVLLLFQRLLEGGLSRARTAALLGALVVVECAWATFHGAFPVGPLAAGAAFAGLLLDRAPRDALGRATLGLIALGLGIVLSPDGIAALLVAGVERDIARAGAFAEWAPLLPALLKGETYRNPSYVAFVVLFLAWLACLARRRQPLFWSRWLVAAPLFVLAFDATRASPYAALSAVVWLSLWAHAAERRLAGRVPYYLLALVAALALARLSTSPLVRQGPQLEALVPARLTPRDAASAAKRLGLEGLLFTRLHLGNWFLLENVDESPPPIRVLWTGRRTYTLACMEQMLAARRDPAGAFEAARARFGFDLVLTDNPAEDPLFRYLVDRGWRLAHFDVRYSLFLAPARDPVSTLSLAPPDVLAGSVDGELLSPLARAGLLLQAAQKLAYLGRHDDALVLFATAAERAPASAAVRLEGAKLLAHLGRIQEARAILRPFAGEPAVRAFLDGLPGRPGGNGPTEPDPR